MIVIMIVIVIDQNITWMEGAQGRLLGMRNFSNNATLDPAAPE